MNAKTIGLEQFERGIKTILASNARAGQWLSSVPTITDDERRAVMAEVPGETASRAWFVHELATTLVQFGLANAIASTMADGPVRVDVESEPRRGPVVKRVQSLLTDLFNVEPLWRFVSRVPGGIRFTVQSRETRETLRSAAAVVARGVLSGAMNRDEFVAALVRARPRREREIVDAFTD